MEQKNNNNTSSQMLLDHCYTFGLLLWPSNSEEVVLWRRALIDLLCIGECLSIAPFLENNGPRPRKGPRSIVFKEWNDTRTFAYIKSTHRLQPLPQYM